MANKVTRYPGVFLKMAIVSVSLQSLKDSALMLVSLTVTYGNSEKRTNVSVPLWTLDEIECRNSKGKKHNKSDN